MVDVGRWIEQKAHQSHKTRGTFSAYLYYEDFPKRGKEIKTCPSCGGR